MHARSHDTAGRPFLRKSYWPACVAMSLLCMDLVYFWLPPTFSDFYLFLGAVLFAADLKHTWKSKTINAKSVRSRKRKCMRSRLDIYLHKQALPAVMQTTPTCTASCSCSLKRLKLQFRFYNILQSW